MTSQAALGATTILVTETNLRLHWPLSHGAARTSHGIPTREEGQVEIDGERRGPGQVGETGQGQKAPKADKAEKPAKTEKPAEVRPPADPRLKVLKKFQGKFLPKGVLRERYKLIMDRWNLGEDHGGVTLDELKKLLDDWKGTGAKTPTLAQGVTDRGSAVIPGRGPVPMRMGLSHGATSIADSCFRNSSGVSLRNSQRVKSGNFRPSRPYGV